MSKYGVSAKELERHLGVTYKTAHRMAVQLRKLMAQDNDKLSRIVEADETHYDGVNKRNRGSKRNTNFDKKKPITGAVERYGRVKAVVVPTASLNTSMSFLKAVLNNGAVLRADKSRIYNWVEHQSKGLYFKDGVITNAI